jgi:hypothetical protein
MNVEKYRQVRTAANRILNKIRASGGHVFYVGLEKNRPVAEFKAQALYLTVLGEAMKRLNQYADQNDADMVIVMDEHQDRDAILTRASQAMYGGPSPARIIEPPFQVESERYQTCQCADWLCGLVGRVGAYQARPDEWADMAWSQTYFQDGSTRHRCSSIRLQTAAAEVETVEALPAVVDTGLAQPVSGNDDTQPDSGGSILRHITQPGRTHRSSDEEGVPRGTATPAGTGSRLGPRCQLDDPTTRVRGIYTPLRKAIPRWRTNARRPWNIFLQRVNSSPRRLTRLRDRHHNSGHLFCRVDYRQALFSRLPIDPTNLGGSERAVAVEGLGAIITTTGAGLQRSCRC